MATTATKKAAKPAASKGAAAKKAEKPAAKPETKAKDKTGLTGRERTVLAALAAGPLTRKDLAKKTGIEKGWSKLLGAATKDNFGGKADGLEPRGLVKSNKEGGALTYSITPAGTKALEESPQKPEGEHGAAQQAGKAE